MSHFLSDNDVWHFSSETLRDLDRALKDNYDEWWRGAPESYRVPEFIDAEPVAILAKYGQNIKICNPTTVHADRATWDDMIDFNNILRIHMAYAVHTQCVLNKSYRWGFEAMSRDLPAFIERAAPKMRAA